MSTVKRRAQAILKRVGLYERLKASRLYDAYWIMADRRVVDGRDAEVKFYRSNLRGLRFGDLIFDIGANQGYKTDMFLRMGARVVAVEPDKHSQEVLMNRFLTYRIRKQPVVIVGKAVSDHDGVADMWLDAPGSAKNTLSGKWVTLLRNDERRFGARLDFQSRQQIETVTLETLIAAYGEPFFIKIDVEGHEPDVLRGLRRPIPYVSFEVNLPEFRPEGEECIELLDTLAPGGTFNYTVGCQHGFVMERWAERLVFLRTFNACSESSIEVFWHEAE